ncbi:MAG: hypothetical protein FJ033_09210 [Chloroflexi bacterium]|nr:hypothetical protein [Chloroflexota bacterium]
MRFGPSDEPGIIDRDRRTLVACLLGRAARAVGGHDAFSFLVFDPANPTGAKPAHFGSDLALSSLGRRLTRRVLEVGGQSSSKTFEVRRA